MYQASQKINVLIVGPTGELGKRVVERCLERPNLTVSVLSEDPSGCPEMSSKITNKGGKCIKGDLTKPETLKDAFKDIHTIISTVEGDDKVYLEGQQNLLKAAVDSKVKRIVPSDFTFDYRNIKEEEHPTLRCKLQIRKMISETSIKGLFIHCGVFMEKLFEIYSTGVVFWENMDQKIAITSIDDVAHVTAAAVSKPDLTGDISVAGDQLSLREIVDRYNALRNTNVPITKMGSLADLQKSMQTIRDKGDIKRAAILNYIFLMTQGKAVLKDLNNSQFPEVKFVRLEQFIKDHPEMRLGEASMGMEKKPIGDLFSDLMPVGQQQSSGK